MLSLYFKKSANILHRRYFLLGLSAALKSVFSRLSALPLLLRGEIVFCLTALK
jgi:hypothetical protein